MPGAIPPIRPDGLAALAGRSRTGWGDDGVHIETYTRR